MSGEKTLKAKINGASEKEARQIQNRFNRLRETLIENRMILGSQYQTLQETFTRTFLSKLDKEKTINADCGYPDTITLENYSEMYEREGISGRVVRAEPNACWKVRPMLVEGEQAEDTAFEKGWKKFARDTKAYSYLKNADVLSGIGHFGIIYIGVNDGLLPHQPIANVPLDGSRITQAPSKQFKVTHMRVFDESVVRISKYVNDPKNPRNGMPEIYDVTFNDVPKGANTPASSTSTTMKIHWTRVIHVADNRRMSEVYGVPRMKDVYNRLYDLRKILGGSGEMFWRGGFPGISFEAAPDAADLEFDKDEIKREIAEYEKGLRRYLTLDGLTAKSLNPQVADPDPHFSVQLKAICIAKGIPYRMLMGTEEAKLAGSQDTYSWNETIKERQMNYVGPFIVEEFAWRCIAIGAIPFPEGGELFVQWPDVHTASADEKAKVAESLTRAMSQYIQAGGETLMVPELFFVHVMGYTEEQTKKIMEKLGTFEGELGKEEPVKLPAGAGRVKGNVPVVPSNNKSKILGVDEFLRNPKPIKWGRKTITIKIATNIVKKVHGGYQVVSSKGKKLSRVYDTKKQAEKRLKEVEMFKHMEKDEVE